MTKHKKPKQNVIKQLAYAAMQILRENGGNMPPSDLRAAVEKREGEKIHDDLMETDSHGRIIWEHLYATTTQVFVDAGYLTKGGARQGWSLTPEGERMLTNSANWEQFFESMKRKAAERRQYIYRLAYVALEILKENDGKMLLLELKKSIEEREGDAISPELKELNPSGHVRWHVRMRNVAKRLFVGAGYLRMSGGTWYLTPEGEEALQSGDEDKVIELAKTIVRQRGEEDTSADLADSDGWSIELVRLSDVDATPDTAAQLDSESDDAGSDEGADIEGYQSAAKTAIKAYIHSMDPYDFQDLCAALLRGMGYHTPEVAARGADGGIDIVAYTDPLGGKPPRVKVQVKRYKDTNIPIEELDKLAGKIRDGEIGVFVTTSGFTRECRRSARDNPRHIELIDFERFLELWITHYDKLPDEDRKRLPLQPIYFLAKE